MKKFFAFLLVLMIPIALCIPGVYGEPEPVTEPEAAVEETQAPEIPEKAELPPAEEEQTVAETEAPELPTEGVLSEEPEAADPAEPAEPAQAEPAEDAPEAEPDAPEEEPVPEEPSPAAGALTIRREDSGRTCAVWYTVEQLQQDGSALELMQVAVFPKETEVTVAGLALDADYRITEETETLEYGAAGKQTVEVRLTAEAPEGEAVFSRPLAPTNWLSDTSARLIQEG